MKPARTPIISISEDLRIFRERSRMMSETAIAPTAAAALIARPESSSEECEAESITAVATPAPAPALTPRMCGSANGFLNTACICAPESESAAPARIAVTIRGSRNSFIINALSDSLPQNKVPKISPTPMLVRPDIRSMTQSTRTRANVVAHTAVSLLFIGRVVLVGY